MALIYIMLGVIFYFVLYMKKKDGIHPVSILTLIWFLTAAIASLGLGQYQTQWFLSTHLMILLAGCATFLGGMVADRTKVRRTIEETPINGTYIIITRCIFFVTVVAVCIIFGSRGMDINYFISIEGGDLKTEVSNQLNGIGQLESYLMNLFPFCALFSFFELLYAKRGEKCILYNLVVIFGVVIYCLFIIKSRGTFLYVLLGFMFIINSKHRIPLKFFGILAVLLIGGMGVIMTSRLFEGSVVFNGVKGISNPILASTYNYIAYCFENFNQIVEDGSRYNLFSNVGQSLYKILGIYDSQAIITHEIAGVFNAIGWLSPFYDDLGIIGIIFYPALIGFFLALFYKKSIDNKYYILALAFLQKAIFIPFFGNYFFTAFSVMVPYFVVAIVCFVSSKFNVKRKRMLIRGTN